MLVATYFKKNIMNNKKLLMYGGGALVLGAVSFFVWSFFQKSVVPIGNTTVDLGSTPKEDVKNSGNNPFANMPTTFEPIQAPNIFSNLDAMIHGGTA